MPVEVVDDEVAVEVDLEVEAELAVVMADREVEPGLELVPRVLDEPHNLA